ncbi:MAG: PA14 domain-containing protein [Planctomycetota bacterium]|nr:PA14 domain-containing protein [Planctomycetota bacterium]
MPQKKLAGFPIRRGLRKNRQTVLLDRAIFASRFNLEGLESRVLLTANQAAGARDLLADISTASPTTSADSQSPVASPSVTQQTGTGLLGVYYNNNNFTAPIVSRVDSTVNFNWASGAPAPGVIASGYSVEWTGQIQAPTTGLYTFDLQSQGGVVLSIGGQDLITDTTLHGAALDSAHAQFVGGQMYSVRIDFVSGALPGQIDLKWSSPTAGMQDVPASALFAQPTAPTSLLAAGSNGQIALSWTGDSGATSYDIYRGTSAGSESVAPYAQNISGSSFTDLAVDSGATYYYTVTAVNAAGQSGASPEASAATPILPPAAPSSVTATAIDTGISLSWAPVNGATSYDVYRADSSGAEANSLIQSGVTGTGLTDTNVTAGTTYYYQVTAVGPGGQSLPSAEVAASEIIIIRVPFRNPALAAPVEVSASIANDGVGLDWAPAEGATSYNIYRGNASGLESSTPLRTNVTDPTFVDSMVTPGTIYYYTITSVNALGQSMMSSEVAALTPVPPPPAPATLTATGGADGITLTWSGADFASSYEVFRGTSSGKESNRVLKRSISDTTFIDAGAVPGQTYFYTVKAFNMSGVGPVSPEASAKIIVAAPPAPATLSTSLVAGGIALQWPLVTGASSYDIYRGASSGGESATPVQTGISGSTWTDASVVDGQTYFYYATAINTGGQSGPSPESTITTPLMAPTSLSAMAGSNGIQLNWAAVSDATSYNIYRGTTSGGESATPYQTNIVGTTFTDAAVTGGNTYFYTVVAVDSAAASPASPEASATSVNPPGIQAPAGLFTTATSTTNVTVSWADVTGETGFTILRSQDGLDYTSVGTVHAGVLNYADSGLTAGSTYYYEVVAASAGGSSPASQPTSATTPLAWVGATQPAPTPSGGWTNGSPGGLITPQSGHRSNVFYVGEPVNFQLGGNPVTYEVRDYYGKLVDQGAATSSTTLNVSQPGWYKLYVYGSNTSAQYGNIIGTATFVIFRNDPNFPQLTDLYAGTYQGGETFIQQAMTRVDPTVNFDWSNTPPTPSMQTTNFAVVWTGQVQPQYSETYTFLTNSDDGVRLWVNGQEIINNWTAHGPTVDTGTISLIAGQRYEIKMEYYQGLYGAVASLSWSSSSTPKQVIPSSALYPTDSAVVPGGLTGTYYNGLTSSDPSEDQVLRAVTAMGPERFNVQDVSNPAAVIATLQADINAANALYIGRDSVRPRALMVAFTNGTSNLANIKQIVTALQGSVTYWEGQNEPNYAYSGAAYASIEQAFHDTVKSVNPHLKVIGPTTVTIDKGPNGLDWINQFLQAGGGNAIDALSFHAYNNVLGSLSLARSSMNGLMSLLNKFGLGNIELWQTEQGSFSAVYGDYQPRLQGRWTMMEQMVFEQYGLPKEHNFIWYDSSHGFWDQPTWWENDDGTLNPAAPLMRVWSEELFGAKFSQAYDFGQYANDLYIGSLFTGPSKSVAVFMSAGQSDGKVTLNVTGGTTLHIVSALGVAQDLPVVNGQVTLAVPEIPVYVEMAQGQSISVVQQNWGPDLALQQGTNASYSGPAAAANGINKIINGAQEDYYDNRNSPWGDLNYTDPNGWVQISLPSVQTISRVNIFAMRPWQLAGTLMDFELQYYDSTSNSWLTLDHVVQQPETFGVYSPVTRTSADSYFNDQFIFQEHFAPVQTSKVRLLIHAVSYGGGATQLVPQSGGQASSTPTLTLSEVEMFGS